MTTCVLCGNRREGEVSVRPRPLPSAAMRQAARDAGRRDHTDVAVCDDVHACLARWPESGPLG